MTYKKVICSKCGKEFEIPLKRYNYKIKNNEKFYCSKKCSTHREQTLCNCATCGKEIYVVNSQLARSKSGNVYCSRHCATIANNHLKVGDKHPNYNGGYSVYRSLALNNYPHECAICHWNEDSDVLQVHHIDSNRQNNSIENLIVLCPTCHFKLTIGKYYLTKDKKSISLKPPGMA